MCGAVPGARECMKRTMLEPITDVYHLGPQLATDSQVVATGYHS